MSELPSLGESHADHLRLILEESGIGAWELDVRTGETWRNLRHDQIFGYDAMVSEWTYERFLSHVAPEDREGVAKLYGRALELRTTWSFECRIDRADGVRRWISATGRPIRDEGGEVVRLIGHVLDISHLKRNEEHLQTVLDELNHRVRNTLAVVQAMAMRSFTADADLKTARRAFMGRIEALATAHNLLSDEAWAGATLNELAAAILAPWTSEAACRISGPRLTLSAKTSISVALVLNELATNALKHGALSVASGSVELTWRRMAGEETLCELVWTERGGPEVTVPKRRSFGVALITEVAPRETGGAAELTFDRSGLRYRLVFPALPHDQPS